MILTPHFLTGAAIINKTNPFLGIILSFLSHYLLDAIPHSEYSIKNIKNRKWKKSFFDFLKIFFDLFLGILIIFIITKKIFLSLIGGFFAIFPDILTFFYILFPQNKILKYHYNFHKKVHFFNKKEQNSIKFKNMNFSEKIYFLFKIFSQIVVFLIAVILLKL